MAEKKGGKQAGSPVWETPFCQNEVPSYVTVERQDGGGVKTVVKARGGLVLISSSLQTRSWALGILLNELNLVGFFHLEGTG